MAPSTWGGPATKAGAAERKPEARRRGPRGLHLAGQGAVRAVVVDKLVKAGEKAQALATSGAALR
jgi:hypothetical protein